MITEGIIAFIWAAAALTFYGSPEALGGATANGKAPALAIQTISESWMGSVGSILVMIGVVILPISTGDGALRVTRLMIADCFKLSQEQLDRRLMIAIPLFAAAIAVSTMDYAVIWQYFGWANQLLAARPRSGPFPFTCAAKTAAAGRAGGPRRLPEPGSIPISVLQPGNVRFQ